MKIKLLTIGWFFLALGFVAGAQEVVVVRSRTDQFIVYGTQSRPQATGGFRSVPLGQGQLFWRTARNQTNETSRVHLVPQLVAASCERIKEALLHEFGEKDLGGRKIHIELNDRINEGDISIAATHYVRGWIYSVELPTEIKTRRFTGAMVQVLLAEMANRNSGEQQIEVPTWLAVGTVAHLHAKKLEFLTLQPNAELARELRVSQDPVALDPIAKVRERFQSETPLTFDELSWPENLSADRAALFQESAQLFFYQLLQLKDGPQSLHLFVTELPHYKNWQFAFLAAFKTHFRELLDVEKWWALQFAAVAERDPTKLWSADESWEKLKAALDVPVQIHLKAERMPVEGKLSLQEVIQQWDVARQEVTLRKTANQLRVMRRHVQPEFISLIDDYRKVLEEYLAERNRDSRTRNVNEPPRNSAALKKSICRQLDALDERRSRVRHPALTEAVPVQSTNAARK